MKVNPTPKASARDTETRPTPGGAPIADIDSESDRLDGTSQVLATRRIRKQL